MPNKISSKSIDEALERLNALPYPPVEGSEEFTEILHWYEQARKRGYKKGRAMAARTICRLYIAQRQFSKLLPYLNEVKALCEENGTWTDMYVECLLMSIETNCTFGNFDKAVETANTFMSGLIHTLTGFPAINSYIVIGNLYQMRGWNIRAMRVFYQGMARKEELITHPMFAGMWVGYAYALFGVKQYESALRERNALMSNKDTVQYPHLVTHCHLFMSQIYAVHYGNYEKCMEHTKTSLQISREHGIHSEEAMMLMTHALNLATLKRYDEALPALQNKQALQIVRDNPSEYAEILNAEAECLLHTGKVKEAWSKLQQVAKKLDHSDSYGVKIKYHQNCALYHRLTGDMEAMDKSTEQRDKLQEQGSRIEFAMQLEQVNAIMELDKKQYELEMQKLKQEKMQQQLDHAAQEKEMLQVAIDQRNALINEFQVAIKKIERSDMKRSEIFQTLNEKISSVKNSNTAIGNFDVRFSEKHKKDSIKISAKYPQISASEIKIACMLASGLSNKEIASVTLTTTRNIENHRLQLRKKMKLKQGEDLIKKLVSILS